MELKPNMYIRTKYDGILKIKNIKEEESFNEYYEMGKKYSYIEKKKFIYYRNDDIKIAINEVIKSSYNIIDLIEAGDYVNGVEVEEINDKEIMLVDTHLWIDKEVANRLIESIVTKEQFENMSYKVGD